MTRIASQRSGSTVATRSAPGRSVPVEGGLAALLNEDTKVLQLFDRLDLRINEGVGNGTLVRLEVLSVMDEFWGTMDGMPATMELVQAATAIGELGRLRGTRRVFIETSNAAWPLVLVQGTFDAAQGEGFADGSVFGIIALVLDATEAARALTVRPPAGGALMMEDYSPALTSPLAPSSVALVTRGKHVVVPPPEGAAAAAVKHHRMLLSQAQEASSTRAAVRVSSRQNGRKLEDLGEMVEKAFTALSDKLIDVFAPGIDTLMSTTEFMLKEMLPMVCLKDMFCADVGSSLGDEDKGEGPELYEPGFQCNEDVADEEGSYCQEVFEQPFSREHHLWRVFPHKCDNVLLPTDVDAYPDCLVEGASPEESEPPPIEQTQARANCLQMHGKRDENLWAKCGRSCCDWREASSASPPPNSPDVNSPSTPPPPPPPPAGTGEDGLPFVLEAEGAIDSSTGLIATFVPIMRRVLDELDKLQAATIDGRPSVDVLLGRWPKLADVSSYDEFQKEYEITFDLVEDIIPAWLWTGDTFGNNIIPSDPDMNLGQSWLKYVNETRLSDMEVEENYRAGGIVSQASAYGPGYWGPLKNKQRRTTISWWRTESIYESTAKGPSGDMRTPLELCDEYGETLAEWKSSASRKGKCKTLNQAQMQSKMPGYPFPHGIYEKDPLRERMGMSEAAAERLLTQLEDFAQFQAMRKVNTGLVGAGRTEFDKFYRENCIFPDGATKNAYSSDTQEKVFEASRSPACERLLAGDLDTIELAKWYFDVEENPFREATSPHKFDTGSQHTEDIDLGSQESGKFDTNGLAFHATLWGPDKEGMLGNVYMHHDRWPYSGTLRTDTWNQMLDGTYTGEILNGCDVDKYGIRDCVPRRRYAIVSSVSEGAADRNSAKGSFSFHQWADVFAADSRKQARMAFLLAKAPAMLRGFLALCADQTSSDGAQSCLDPQTKEAVACDWSSESSSGPFTCIEAIRDIEDRMPWPILFDVLTPAYVFESGDRTILTEIPLPEFIKGGQTRLVGKKFTSDQKDILEYKWDQENLQVKRGVSPEKRSITAEDAAELERGNSVELAPGFAIQPDSNFWHIKLLGRALTFARLADEPYQANPATMIATLMPTMVNTLPKPAGRAAQPLADAADWFTARNEPVSIEADIMKQGSKYCMPSGKEDEDGVRYGHFYMHGRWVEPDRHSKKYNRHMKTLYERGRNLDGFFDLYSDYADTPKKELKKRKGEGGDGNSFSFASMVEGDGMYHGSREWMQHPLLTGDSGCTPIDYNDVTSLEADGARLAKLKEVGYDAAMSGGPMAGASLLAGPAGPVVAAAVKVAEQIAQATYDTALYTSALKNLRFNSTVEDVKVGANMASIFTPAGWTFEKGLSEGALGACLHKQLPYSREYRNWMLRAIDEEEGYSRSSRTGPNDEKTNPFFAPGTVHEAGVTMFQCNMDYLESLNGASMARPRKWLIHGQGNAMNKGEGGETECHTRMGHSQATGQGIIITKGFETPLSSNAMADTVEGSSLLIKGLRKAFQWGVGEVQAKAKKRAQFKCLHLFKDAIPAKGHPFHQDWDGWARFTGSTYTADDYWDPSSSEYNPGSDPVMGAGQTRYRIPLSVTADGGGVAMWKVEVSKSVTVDWYKDSSSPAIKFHLARQQQLQKLYTKYGWPTEADDCLPFTDGFQLSDLASVIPCMTSLIADASTKMFDALLNAASGGERAISNALEAGENVAIEPGQWAVEARASAIFMELCLQLGLEALCAAARFLGSGVMSVIKAFGIRSDFDVCLGVPAEEVEIDASGLMDTLRDWISSSEFGSALLEAMDDLKADVTGRRSLLSASDAPSALSLESELHTEARRSLSEHLGLHLRQRALLGYKEGEPLVKIKRFPVRLDVQSEFAVTFDSPFPETYEQEWDVLKKAVGDELASIFPWKHQGTTIIQGTGGLLTVDYDMEVSLSVTAKLQAASAMAGDVIAFKLRDMFVELDLASGEFNIGEPYIETSHGTFTADISGVFEVEMTATGGVRVCVLGDNCVGPRMSFNGHTSAGFDVRIGDTTDGVEPMQRLSRTFDQDNGYINPGLGCHVPHYGAMGFWAQGTVFAELGLEVDTMSLVPQCPSNRDGEDDPTSVPIASVGPARILNMDASACLPNLGTPGFIGKRLGLKEYNPDFPQLLLQHTVYADWGKSFDSAGWSSCEASGVLAELGGATVAITSLTRSDSASGGELYNLEGAGCAPFFVGADKYTDYDCITHDVSSSLDTAGWSLCPDGRYLTGLRRGADNGLNSIEEMRCCGHKHDYERSLDGCYDNDVSGDWFSDQDFTVAGTASCRDGYALVGFYRDFVWLAGPGTLSDIERMRCCRIGGVGGVEMKAVTLASVTVRADWSISFDSEGWSTCAAALTGRKSATLAMVGLERSGDPGTIINLEGAPCRPLMLASEVAEEEGAFSCAEVDISQSFNSAGWATCPYGRFLGGLHRGSASDALNQVDTLSCCGATEPSNRAWGECTDVDVSLSFDSPGTVECPDNSALVGVYRSDAGNGGRLYNVETMRCCQILSASLSPSIPPSLTLFVPSSESFGFDTEGWARCPTNTEVGGEDVTTMLTGLTRGVANELSGLEGAPCTHTFVAPGADYDCAEVDIAQSFDGQSWAVCPFGRYLSGLRRDGAGEALSNLAALSCCGAASEYDRAWDECVDVNIALSFDGAGTVECPAGTALVGLQRSGAGDGGRLYNVETMRCCSLQGAGASAAPPSPPPPPSPPSPPPVARQGMPDGSWACSEGAYLDSIFVYRSGAYIEHIPKISCSNGEEIALTYSGVKEYASEPCEVEVTNDRELKYENHPTATYNTMSRIGDSCTTGAPSSASPKRLRVNCPGDKRFVGITVVMLGAPQGIPNSQKYVKFLGILCEDGQQAIARADNS